MASRYQQQLAAQQRAAADARFRSLYPGDVWNRMSPVEQAQARAAFEQARMVAAAQEQSGRGIRTTLVVIFVVVPAVLVLLWILIVRYAP